MTTTGNVTSEDYIQARDIITGIQQNFTIIFRQPFAPPPDLAELRRDYLTYLRHCYHYLDMKGIMQVQQVMQQLPLAAVYVPLKAHTQPTGRAKLTAQVAGRRYFWPDQANLETIIPAGQVEAQPIEVSLKHAPAMVVLGDPGAGKSTLLKILTLALAGQAAGPLPILLPLNAYARRLGQGEISLSQFLGDYYAARQQKLSRVGHLFEAALAAGQAVVLLDGLDEVQADRQYLVRLVQDFVAEHILPPVDDPETVVPGNRIVVTSRIVGYEEAPLAGRQWRLATLTDFNRADIEQFVEQWTLAFAISVQGDSPPVRQAAERERRELLETIFSRPSVERMASNPLLLTILALIKYTGVVLPEQRVKLYELYLEALIESWNLARSLDQKPVGPGLNYEETVQVLAPLALWLRRENPTAGLVSRDQLEGWLTGYYHGEEWGLPKGKARQRARDFIKSVESHSNLLLERGEQQYGFLHLTLEEMLAGKGLAQLYFDDPPQALTLFERYLADSTWHETLQLAVAAVGILKQQPRQAGAILQQILEMASPQTDPGRAVILAGQILLDMGQTGVSRAAAQKVTATLVESMQSGACPIRSRRDAGDLLGRLGWRPDPALDDLLLATAGLEPTGLDAFRRVETDHGPIWMGKYPVTNAQFARFIEAGGYDNPDFWSQTGWAWRTGRYDSQAPADVQEWLKKYRPTEKRAQPYFWEMRPWNSPLCPVVGVSWFEAEAYAGWLTTCLNSGEKKLPSGKLVARLPTEMEWQAAMGSGDDYPWGNTFDPTCLNCADSWAGRELSEKAWNEWNGSNEESRQEASTTAVTTYPHGVSPAGVWDGSGNIWEWTGQIEADGWVALRGGSWYFAGTDARVSSRTHGHPVTFDTTLGFRVVVARRL
jgi:formylglycine-generating enzyme required for sulfatase activity